MANPSASRRPARRKLSVDNEIAHLRGLEFAGQRARWQSVMGRPAPLHIPQHLLFGILAYRIQADALGDLDAETTRLLKKIGSVKSPSEIAPLTDASDQRRRDLLPGTVLSREWNDRNHRVMLLAEGFAWDGMLALKLKPMPVLGYPDLIGTQV